MVATNQEKEITKKPRRKSQSYIPPYPDTIVQNPKQDDEQVNEAQVNEAQVKITTDGRVLAYVLEMQEVLETLRSLEAKVAILTGQLAGVKFEIDPTPPPAPIMKQGLGGQDSLSSVAVRLIRDCAGKIEKPEAFATLTNAFPQASEVKINNALNRAISLYKRGKS